MYLSKKCAVGLCLGLLLNTTQLSAGTEGQGQNESLSLGAGFSRLNIEHSETGQSQPTNIRYDIYSLNLNWYQRHRSIGVFYEGSIGLARPVFTGLHNPRLQDELESGSYTTTIGGAIDVVVGGYALFLGPSLQVLVGGIEEFISDFQTTYTAAGIGIAGGFNAGSIIGKARVTGLFFDATGMPDGREQSFGTNVEVGLTYSISRW